MRSVRTQAPKKLEPRRRDPAPSRLAYRVNRWMLSPLMRLFLRRGLPLMVLAGGLALLLGHEERREMLLGEMRALVVQVQERPEFMVNLLAIDGASPALADEIRVTAQLDLPTSSFDLDLEALRARLQEARPVKQVHLRIRPAGILQVDVVERQPVLVWRRASGVELLDEDGVSIADISSRAAYPHLPLVAGEGVQPHVDEALRVLAAARPLQDRLRGLVRVGERRWDLVLDQDQRILLPTQGPVAALQQVIHLQAQDQVLDYAVSHVDMRLPSRPTLRRLALPEPVAEDDTETKPTGVPVASEG
ncbi:MAG: FtsQ-type POTRA domain-containing protein [Rhodobacteraceae bacterium]|nr:FtsQ-type POTRA domain-containing protein [Paracoccaceae bacterium]